jgi:predicted phage tail protein
MFTTIKLHGVLGKTFGKEFQCVAHSVADAVRFLEVNFPSFRGWILDAHDRGTVFRVRVNKYTIGEDELLDPVPLGKTIHITPLVSASGNSGLFKIIAGVALIGLGVAGISFLGLSPLSMIITGALLVISGLMGNRTPAADPDEENTRSFVFSGATNTTAAGGRVPVVYGVMQTGSTVVSASVRSYQIA